MTKPNSIKIAIVGTGYVGLVTGVALALLGHKVICIGRDKNKIEKINKGFSPFYEPGLDNLLNKTLSEKLLKATDDFKKALLNADIIIIAVGTPTVGDKIDLSAIKEVARRIGEQLKHSKKYQVIVVKSTVVPTTTEKVVKTILEKYSGKKIGDFGLCMSPEFLREGNAVEDATNPDRIVIGQYDEKSGRKFAEIYVNTSCPKVFTNLTTAEMTKYAANALFATLISYSNEIARICETIGSVDVVDVWKGVHLDSRLSPKINNRIVTPGILSYILSGCGYGGSCFPKDTKALSSFAKLIGIDAKIIKSVIDVNATQPKRVINILKSIIADLRNKRITVLGLSFKPNTDDLRESPSLEIIRLLEAEGVIVTACDPAYQKKDERKELELLNFNLVGSPETAIKNADGVILATAWEEYKKLKPDFFKKLMKTPVIIDGRRIYERAIFIDSGVIYKGIGLIGNS